MLCESLTYPRDTHPKPQHIPFPCVHPVSHLDNAQRLRGICLAEYVFLAQTVKVANRWPYIKTSILDPCGPYIAQKPGWVGQRDWSREHICVFYRAWLMLDFGKEFSTCVVCVSSSYDVTLICSLAGSRFEHFILNRYHSEPREAALTVKSRPPGMILRKVCLLPLPASFRSAVVCRDKNSHCRLPRLPVCTEIVTASHPLETMKPHKSLPLGLFLSDGRWCETNLYINLRQRKNLTSLCVDSWLKDPRGGPGPAFCSWGRSGHVRTVCVHTRERETEK